MSVENKHSTESAPQTPEQQAVDQLTSKLLAALESKDTKVAVGEDGSQTRVLRGGNGYVTFTERIAADGTPSLYTFRTLFKQSFDQGTVSQSWQAGGETIATTSDLELAGVSTTERVTLVDISRVTADLDYLIDKYVPKPPQRKKARIGKFIGSLIGRH